MPDVEKVIALLERYVRIPNLAGAENYGAKIVDMPEPLITDALALLKAQEPVEPELITETLPYHYACGACGLYLPFVGAKYCSYCGKAVKWE